MRVDHFFPVPLLVHDADSAVQTTIQQKVAAWLGSERARQLVQPAPEESVTTSFFRPEASVLIDANLPELEALILEAARFYLEQNMQLAPRPLEIQQAWINVFEPGAQEAQHSHDGSLLSCSYYVEAPENCGCIGFPDPVGARRSYREFTETAGEYIHRRREMVIEPKPGRLVMFESWVPHYIQCNKSGQVRVSIAVNLRYAPIAQGAIRKQHSVLQARSPEAQVARPQSEPLTAPAAHNSGRAAAGPFLFNEVFDVSPDLSIKPQKVADSIPVVVIDDLLRNPELAREVAGSTPATNWKHEEGGRNFIDYYDCRLRFPIRFPNKMVAVAQQAIARVSPFATRPQDASVDVNWFMQVNPRRADFAVPHCDITEGVTRSFTCIVYLNTAEECSGGTAFFRYRPSGSLVFDEAYTRAVVENPDLGEKGLDYWPVKANEYWEQVAEVEMRPGRLVIFPSEFFHAAAHPEDSFLEFPRLTLAFWMVV